MNQALADKLKTLPASPGVYFHKDQSGEVIYVGKAAVLKNRVRQYFSSSPKDLKTTKLVQHIAMTDWIETDSEIDALFLENEMIKRYLPKYNILLRDDKNNSYVRINFHDEYPLVTTTRAPADDGANYIGPFYGGAPLRKALRYLRKTFPYLAKPGDRQSALLKQLGLVPSGSSTDYRADLHQLVRYLKGGRVKLQREITKEMKQASDRQDYETALRLRNKLTSLNELRRQIIFGRDEFMDISKDKALMEAKQLFQLADIPRRLECYDISHQSGQNVVGAMVVATNGVADKREYRKFQIHRHRNDDFAAMAEVMERRFSPRHLSWGVPDLIIVDGGEPQLRAVHRLVLNIPLVGLAKRNDELIVSKHYSHIRPEGIQHLLANPEPGVLVTDRGDYYSLNFHLGAHHSASHSFTMLGETTVNRYTDLLKLLQRLRNESHRFAISYHRSLKTRGQTGNLLESIPGVGPATRRKLLRRFGSVQQVRQSEEAELARVVGAKLAHRIKSRL